MHPLLNYYGGKQHLAPILSSLIVRGSFDTYCEPFCGSAAVFFAAPGRWARIEILNDVSGELMNFYRVMRDDLLRPQLLDLLEFTPHSRETWREALHSKEDSPVRRAWRFFVIGQQSFNTAKRSWRLANRTHNYAAEWRDQCERLGAISFIRRLQHASIECQSFDVIMQRLDAPDTLFYMDPPYIGAKDQAGMKRAYDGFFLTPEQDALLIKLCIHAQGGIILSGYPRDDLPQSWQRLIIDVPVHSRYDTSEPERAKGRATETIWVNPRAQLPRLF